eukprot:COSAG04_NODE_201_length_20457_cov_316.186462_18_plen_79_part_00
MSVALSYSLDLVKCLHGGRPWLHSLPVGADNVRRALVSGEIDDVDAMAAGVLNEAVVYPAADHVVRDAGSGSHSAVSV